MRAFVFAVIAAMVVAVGAAWMLNTQQKAVWEAFTTSAVRVGDPGHNLVGPWENSAKPADRPE
jgi:hypothetical protein